MRISHVLSIAALACVSVPAYAADPAQAEAAMQRHNELLEHISMGTLEVVNDHRKAFRVSAGLSACGKEILASAVMPSKQDLMDSAIKYTAKAVEDPGRGLEIFAGIQSAVTYHQLGFKDAVEILLDPKTKAAICDSFTRAANDMLQQARSKN